ncbi:MAG TPA: hypothetical protein ENI73_05850 [Spirochaetes bacterium]|nr:hypothetical protein [Spirochaetota bacterium]
MKGIKEINENSEEQEVINSLINCGKAKWAGGKPVGMKGIQIKGKSLSETVVEGRFDPVP